MQTSNIYLLENLVHVYSTIILHFFLYVDFLYFCVWCSLFAVHCSLFTVYIQKNHLIESRIEQLNSSFASKDKTKWEILKWPQMTVSWIATGNLDTRERERMREFHLFQDERWDTYCLNKILTCSIDMKVFVNAFQDVFCTWIAVRLPL